MKKFLSSLWFKCIATLLIIIVISGGLLSILSDLLYVSDVERTERAIASIYNGEIKKFTEIELPTANPDEEFIDCANFGSIDKIYKIEGESANEFDLLFHTIGKQGFKNGSITYWIKLSSINGELSIGKMIIEKDVDQSFIGNLDETWHSAIYVNIDENSKYLTPYSKVAEKDQNYSLVPTTGATNSKRASCNAVNSVIYFINNYELGGVI